MTLSTMYQTVSSYRAPISQFRPLPVAAEVPGLIERVVAAAIRAPSLDNLQPWIFGFDGQRLFVRLDPDRGAGSIDAGSRASLVAVGAAIEHAHAAAAAEGYRMIPVDPWPTAIACFEFDPDATMREDPIAQYHPHIARRVTNRHPGVGEALAPRDIHALVGSARAGGGHLEIRATKRQLRAVGRVAGVAERVRLLNPQLLQSMMAHVRWSDQDARARRDGIPVSSLPSTMAAVLHLIGRPEVLPCTTVGRATEAWTTKVVESSAAVGLLYVQRGGSDGAVAEGRALARVWLEATARNIAVHPIAIGPLLFSLLDAGRSTRFTPAERVALAEASAEMDGVFPRRSGIHERSTGMLLRFFYPDRPAAMSSRRSIEDVLRREP